MSETAKVAPISVKGKFERNLLSSPVRRGFYRRWVRNTEEDVEAMKEMGYQPVIEDDKVKTRRDMVLMETPQDLRDERVTQLVAEQKESRRRLRQAAGRETDQIAASANDPKGQTKTIGEVTLGDGGKVTLVSR